MQYGKRIKKFYFADDDDDGVEGGIVVCFIFFKKSASASCAFILFIFSISCLNLFTKIHYEVDRQITISNTYNDDTLPILSLIKRYSTLPSKDLYLWRKLFLLCYIENKILLKSIIVSSK